MSDPKFNRDTRGDDHKGYQKDSNVNREIDELIKAKATDYQAWQKLKAKYGNNQDLMDKVMDGYKSKLQYIYKKANKFKRVLYDKYNSFNLSYGEMLRKAKKYQKKYKFTDDEFDMFIMLTRTDKASKYVDNISTTKMAKTLGFDAFLATSSKLNVKAEEQSIVEEIVNRYGETKPLHAQVLLQSLTYRDCAPEALQGGFDEKKHNPYSYIHPILAAMFLPRFASLDQRMLMANIGYIVHRKATGEPIYTLPDFQLYWDMVTDPNDIACTLDNAVVDLKNRFILQTHIWDSVLNLRQGKYYYGDSGMFGLVKFMQAVENCRNIIHDAPDLTYVKDEGTIMRRILSAFSMYPTYVSVNRLWGLLVGTYGGLPASPLEASGFANITKVPMITLRLPLNISGRASAVSLEESLTQPQWFIENKTLVPKSLQLIHSSDVLFFYVNRRYQTINVARLASPYNFTRLPMTVTGWESLNSYPVNAPRHLPIMNDTYELRSVVLVEKGLKYDNTELIVGSSALIVRPRDITTGDYQENCWIYDPQRAGMTYVNQQTTAPNSHVHYKPISSVPSHSPLNPVAGLETFDQKASTQGTIYIYQKITSNANPLFDPAQGAF